MIQSARYHVCQDKNLPPIANYELQTSDAYHDEAILGLEWEKEVNRRVEKLATDRGVSMAQVALGK